MSGRRAYAARCIHRSLDARARPVSTRPAASMVTRSPGSNRPRHDPPGVMRKRPSLSRAEMFPSVPAARPRTYTRRPISHISRRSDHSEDIRVPVSPRWRALTTAPTAVEACGRNADRTICRCGSVVHRSRPGARATGCCPSEAPAHSCLLEAASRVWHRRHHRHRPDSR